MRRTASRIHALAAGYSATELVHAAAVRTAAELLADTGGTITVAVLDEHVARYRALLLDALARATARDEP